MNDDALAAVVAAAQLYLTRTAAGAVASDAPSPASRWAIAGRLRAAAWTSAGDLSRARSRWASLGRRG